MSHGTHFLRDLRLDEHMANVRRSVKWSDQQFPCIDLGGSWKILEQSLIYTELPVKSLPIPGSLQKAKILGMYVHV